MRRPEGMYTTLRAMPITTLATAVCMRVCRLTGNQITDNVLLLLLAGHDTSSTTLTKCFSNLQDHPAVMEKLRAEQKVLVAKHGEGITPAVLRDMTYADAVIRWALGVGPGGSCGQHG